MDLSQLSKHDLERLQGALSSGRLRYPLSSIGLQGEGLGGLVQLASAFNALGKEGALGVIAAVLADRNARGSPPELVWTGPEGNASRARDTAVVLDDVFERATSRVLIAGYRFDHAEDLLRPLHAVMKSRNVNCRIFADQKVAEFRQLNWPFGPPFPEIYGFVPAKRVYASLHAKCVVVDGRWVFVTSANFTDRGQTRNIEVGVLLEDTRIAAALEAQFVAGPWFELFG